MRTRLTFENGKFKFSGINFPYDHVVSSRWASDARGFWTTTDFNQANELREWADPKVLSILDRAFVKRFGPPVFHLLPSFLDPHQKDGINWVLTRSRSYLAHAPGAGKTAQAIVAAVLLGVGTEIKGQAVFIVPPQLTVNWAREVYKFFELMSESPQAWPRVGIVPESSNQAFTGWNSDFLIVPDSMITKPWVLTRLGQMSKRLIAVDEASRFKESTSQRTIALFGGTLEDGTKSPGLVYNAERAVLLDGSPMPNRPMELWAPTYAMCPEAIDFMSQSDFGFRYCGAKMNNFGRWEFKHSSHEEELQTRLQKDFMHVVTESELSHPERRRSMVIMTGDVRSREMREWDLKNLSGLKLSEITEDASQGELANFRRELGIRKAPWIANYVRDRILTKNESILLFCWHRDVALMLQESLARFKPGLVMGGTPGRERENAFQQFQDGRTKLLIGNIGAMGRGHNLQRADRVIFGEFSWTDELNKQCEKRASRKGSTKLITRCDYIVAPGSMDEPILNAVFAKAKRVKRIIG